MFTCQLQETKIELQAVEGSRRVLEHDNKNMKDELLDLRRRQVIIIIVSQCKLVS